MLSLFKTRPKLAQLIPANYVDIHSHILPGIDDGAKTIADSKFLLDEMKQLGFSKIITTPHTMEGVWNNTPSTIENALAHMTSELTLPVPVGISSEYFLDESVVLRAQNKEMLPLKDNYILVEMSYLNAPIQLYDFIFELQLAGYRIILAHPERYSFYHNNFKAYEKLKKMGCMFQLNLLATTGYYGESTTKVADELLKKGMYDFVGSDIHHKLHVQSFATKIKISNQKALEQALENNIFFQ